MPRPRVYVARPVFDEALALLRAVADVRVWHDDLPPPYETLFREARDADGLFTLLTDRIDAPLLDASPRLRVVSNMAVGYNNINVPAATKRGVYVGNTPGVLTETTAEFTFALLLGFARRICESRESVYEGKWRTWAPMGFLGTDLHGATLGLVGLGRIGQAVARIARGFDMRVMYYSRTHRPEVAASLGLEFLQSLDKLLPRADYVSIHVPLTPETWQMFDEPEFRLMKPNAVLINTSRGEVIDQKALYEALKAGRIAGAALDVTDPEPMPANDPLLTLPNVLITPHIASASRATRLKMATMAAQNIVDALQGKVPTNCVNPEAAGARRQA
ncbi:MAG: D-glycerate dehydrogenase [Chloroflexi bacterium]|nr:D-glycerate dehydrogenase [Chloroflexota bacterium]